MKTESINRRGFLKYGATAAFALGAYGTIAHTLTSPNKPWRVAVIGTGWYGKSDLFRLIQVADVEVVGLCDVDSHQLAAAGKLVSQRQKSGKTPALYADYQKLLSEQHPDIVLIGTPDHWHALTAIAAMRSGAHVYVQKPISVDVIEGEAMVAAARKFNRVVQVGTQRRSTPHLVEAKQHIVDAGLLGKISHAEMCCYYHMRSNENPPIQAVPDFLDYNQWTGPAPLRAYDGLPHLRWRAYMEYGNGIMGDMCIHMFDAVRWMLNLGWPTRIVSSGGIYQPNGGSSNIADTQTAVFEYPELNCVWQHRTWGTPSDPDYPWSFTLYGDKGTLRGDPYKYDFTPSGPGQKIHKEALYEKEKYPEDVTEANIEIHAAPATRQHMMDFLNAIETGKRPVADIEQGHISTASCILANLSMKLGRTLKYDPASRTIVDDTEATVLLKRTYRPGWRHPEPDAI